MRTVLLVTAAAVVLTPLVAQAAPAPKDRVVTSTYTGLIGLDNARFSVTLGCLPSATVVGRAFRSCASFESQKGERSLTLSAVDDAGVPAGLAVQVGESAIRYFCGTVKLPLPPKASVPVRAGAASVGGPACPAATTGTLTARFSRR